LMAGAKKDGLLKNLTKFLPGTKISTKLGNPTA